MSRGPLKISTSKPEPPRVVLEKMPVQRKTAAGIWMERIGIAVAAVLGLWFVLSRLIGR